MTAKKKKAPKPKRMSARMFRNALEELGLTVAGQRTAKALGIGIRNCQRLAVGERPVPRPIELLLQMYLTHGLPDEE